MAPYKILKQGYMEKEPPLSKRGLRKKLFRYWFVLVEDKKQIALVYFKNEDQYIARQRNEGFIRVDQSQNISVVGEYMGRKHSFVIKTDKGVYTLAPESRYDLHEWLFTLHNSLELFKKKQERLKQRQSLPGRPRSNTVDSSTTRPQNGGPPHTPTRRAPPPPTGQRRRPSRPAPLPPSPNTQPSHNSVGVAPDETPPPSYTESDSVVTEMMELNISTQQDSPENQLYVLDQPHPLPDQLPEPSNLMHQTSSSLPDLLIHDEDTPTTTPDNDLREEGAGQQGNPLLDKNTTPAHSHIRHTRHHSLTLTEIKAKKKRSSRRQGSLKLRSRSPPELPPPPPPEGESPSSPGYFSESTNEFSGHGGVMETLSDIEQQIDKMSDEFSPRPTIPAPIRPDPMFQYNSSHSPSPVLEVPDGFNEEEWLCDLDNDHNDHTALSDEVRQGILASPENAVRETISAELGVRKSGKQVMFKEEVEDIPITYEPVADGNSDSADSSDEAIPSSVAELKKRLFGDKEGDAARYKREGPLSPAHKHPLNATFDQSYFEEKSTNVNNNNSGNAEASADEANLYDAPWDTKTVATKVTQHSEFMPPLVKSHPETTPPPFPRPVVMVTENSVASSWAQRSALTEDTPLPQHTTLTLENESLLSSISSTLQETSKYGSDSFLSNIETTSVKKNNGLTAKGELEKMRAEHRRDPPPPSQQGISPLHQAKSSPPVPHRTSKLSSQAIGTSPKTSPHHIGGSPHRIGGSPQAMRKKWAPGQRSFTGPPRGAVSLDTLREPSVTYDANTNSHIFRSLV